MQASFESFYGFQASRDVVFRSGDCLGFPGGMEEARMLPSLVIWVEKHIIAVASQWDSFWCYFVRYAYKIRYLLRGAKILRAWFELKRINA